MENRPTSFYCLDKKIIINLFGSASVTVLSVFGAFVSTV